jgi:hypothetical protein
MDAALVFVLACIELQMSMSICVFVFRFSRNRQILAWESALMFAVFSISIMRSAFRFWDSLKSLQAAHIGGPSAHSLEEACLETDIPSLAAGKGYPIPGWSGTNGCNDTQARGCER